MVALELVPSPKSHAHETTSPSGSAEAEPSNVTSRYVAVCENRAVGAWFGLMRAGRQSGEIGVDRYFEQQISLAGFADVAENALDDIPIIWACTPAREMGYTLAERMLQRIGHDDGHSRNLTLSARLVVAK